MAIDVGPDVRTENSLIPDRAQLSRSQAPVDSSPRNRKLTVVAGLIAIIVLLGLATAYIFGGVAPEASNPKLTHVLGRRDLRVTITENGTIESSNNTEVRCKVKGANNTVVWIIKNGTVVQPGDLLVRIDTSTIETNINTKEIAYQNALAAFAQSQSDVAVSEINITEYLEGTFRSELKTKEKDVAIAQANLKSAQNILDHAKEMYRKGFVSKLELQGNEYSLQQAQLELEVKQTDVEVLTTYTREKKLLDFKGILAAKQAKNASDKAALELEKLKLDLERKQLENCEIVAEKAGMVTYARGEEWQDKPDIREGATVREDQIMLLIPDLGSMQVKVGVHESLVGQVTLGMPALIQLQDSTLTGTVSSVAPVAGRSGWWNGNMVKYETIIKLESDMPLKPGMSSSVEIVLAEHTDVLAIPVAAAVEHDEHRYCWVKTTAGLERRELKLGDSDDQFIVVEAGVEDGEEVVLNPLAYVEEAKKVAMKPYSVVKSTGKKEASESQQKPAAESSE